MTIMGNDFCVMDVPLPIILINIDLLTIPFDDNDKLADQVYQNLLDKQEKVQLKLFCQ